MTLDFSTTPKGRREWRNVFKVLRELFTNLEFSALLHYQLNMKVK